MNADIEADIERMAHRNEGLRDAAYLVRGWGHGAKWSERTATRLEQLADDWEDHITDPDRGRA